MASGLGLHQPKRMLGLHGFSIATSPLLKLSLLTNLKRGKFFLKFWFKKSQMFKNNLKNLHFKPTLVISSSSSILISILIGVSGNALKTSRRVGICLSSEPDVT